jgi:AraC-like DNA-binding protein/quercetin dioxygenase-like cupin family protein
MGQPTGRQLAVVALNRSEVRRLHPVGLEQVLHRQPGQEWVPHWHDEWSFGAIVAGTCHCSVAGQPLVAEAGDVIAIAPGVVHTGALLPPTRSGAVKVVMFYVPAAWLEQRQLVAPARSGRVRLPTLARAARPLDTAEEAQAWLLGAVPALARALRSDGAEAASTMAVRSLVRRVQLAVLDGEQSVSGLARRCEVSRERIHRVMKHCLGMAPRDYLRAVRLHRARQLVMAGEPIAAVAAECGFADQAHFTRWFRRSFGYTPGDLAGASLGR